MLHGSIELVRGSTVIRVEIVEDSTHVQAVHTIISLPASPPLLAPIFFFFFLYTGEVSVDDLPSSLFAQYTRFGGFGAAVTALLSAEEGQHAIGLLALVVATL